MENYICKIASVEDMQRKWDQEIANHPDDQRWLVWKKHFIEAVQKKTRICYYGILDDKIISEATAVIDLNDRHTQHIERLVGKHQAYLTAFRTEEAYQGQGYFSKLYRFMENDLKNRGFTALTLGVEPEEIKNRNIYWHWGFDSLLMHHEEIYPPQSEGEDPEKISVLYYLKKLTE